MSEKQQIQDKIRTKSVLLKLSSLTKIEIFILFQVKYFIHCSSNYKCKHFMKITVELKKELTP